MGCFVRMAKMAWDVMSGVTKTAWDVMPGVTKTAWDVLSGVANLCGMFCPGWQKWHGMFCPGMFCPTPFKMCLYPDMISRSGSRSAIAKFKRASRNHSACVKLSIIIMMLISRN